MNTSQNRLPTLVPRLISTLLIGMISVQSVWAQQLPDLGDSSSNSLSPAMEKRVGQEALNSFRFDDPGYIDDPEVEAYLDSLGARLTASGKAGPNGFTFFALKDSTINAFAMPGGFIGVHSGLVVTSQNESELAAVISHEMAHVEQHHIARTLAHQSNMTPWLLASMLIAVFAARNSPNASEAILATSQAAAIQDQLNYSRDFEKEADRIGLQILDAAGFDPQGMTSFFARMQKASQLSESDAPTYLRTHPLTQDRISDIEGRVRNLPYRQVPDSIEYTLTKARLATIQGNSHDTILSLTKQEGGRVQDQAARAYGLTLAYIAEHDIAKAQDSYAKLSALKLKTPMLAPLEARLEIAQGHADAAAKICQAARAEYPGWRPLSYCEVEGLLQAGNTNAALSLLKDQIHQAPDDFRLYALQARAYTLQNKPALMHQAQAHIYQIHGMLRAAIEQMRLAQRSRGANAYEAAAIEAQLKELRRSLCATMDAPASQGEASKAPKGRRDPDSCDRLSP